MRDFINHYSLGFLLLLAIGILIFTISQYRDNRWILVLVVSALIILSFGYVHLRTGTGSTAQIEVFDNDLGAGTPVFIEFYSDF